MRTECRSRGGGTGLAANAFAPASCFPKQLATGELLIRPGADEKFRLVSFPLKKRWLSKRWASSSPIRRRRSRPESFRIGSPISVDQTEISDRVLERVDFAVLTRIDRPNRYKSQAESVPGSENNTFGLELKPVARRHQDRQKRLASESKAALAIRNRHLTDPSDLPGHDLISPSTNQRHRLQVQHPIADDEVEPGTVDGVEKSGDIGRIMLTIAIQKQEIFSPGGDCVRQPGLQSSALSKIRWMANHIGACGFGLGSRIVGRPVIDHQHGLHVLHDASNDIRNESRFTIGRDDRKNSFPGRVHRTSPPATVSRDGEPPPRMPVFLRVSTL